MMAMLFLSIFWMLSKHCLLGHFHEKAPMIFLFTLLGFSYPLKVTNMAEYIFKCSDKWFSHSVTISNDVRNVKKNFVIVSYLRW